MSDSGTYSKEGLESPLPRDDLTKITEGYAAVLFLPPKGYCKNEEQQTQPQHSRLYDGQKETNQIEDDQSVFYNPAQVVNRDLTICVIETFSRQRRDEHPRKGGVGDKGIIILEALSATGLRSIRYWKEVTGIHAIIANDIDADAVETMKLNLSYNGIPNGKPTLVHNYPGEDWRGVIPNRDDAIVLMQRLGLPVLKERLVSMRVATSRGESTAEAYGVESSSSNGYPLLNPLLQSEKMDVVDLDPYGTASPFLDPTFQCIKEGGLVCVTSTDSAILCGSSYPETGYAKYSSIPAKTDACAEMAVRLLLAYMERVANKHKKYIVPLLCLHIDFYVRVFVRVNTQQVEVKLSCTKLGHLFKCTQCPNYRLLPVARVKVTCKKYQKEATGTGKRERDEKAAKTTVTDNINNDKNMHERTKKLPTMEYGAIHDRKIPFTVSPSTLQVAADQRNDLDPDFDYSLHYTCNVCHGSVALAGPLYCAPIHNTEFLDSLLSVIDEKHSGQHITATNRIRGLVLTAKSEIPNAPLFVDFAQLASLVKCVCPPLPLFVGALRRHGYSCSQVHCDKNGLKVNAPMEVLVGVMLAYKEHLAQQLEGNSGGNEVMAMKEGKKQLEEDQAVAGEQGLKEEKVAGSKLRHGGRMVYVPAILSDFSYDPRDDFKRRSEGPRFVPNAPGWGPKKRHTGAAH